MANAGDREGSPQASLRDTQNSFASFNRSNQGEPMSPASAARLRRSQRDFGQTDTGQSWNRQNSEVRARRPTEFAGAAGMMDRHDSMRITGQSWADRRAA